MTKQPPDPHPPDDRRDPRAPVPTTPNSPERNRTTGEPKSIEHPEEGTRLSAKEIHANVLASAETELERTSSSLLLSAIAAGLTIGLSFLAGGWVREFAPEHLDRFAVALAYPLGFIFVVLARNELYTENTLEPVIPLLHKRDAKTFGNMMRLWGLLILGNLAGGLIFALVIAKTPALQDRMHVELLAIARESTSDSAWLNFYRGIFAGWLLAMLTWVLASTHERLTQVLLIALATIPIAAFDFRHSIVGSVEAFYRVAMGDAGMLALLGSFVVPCLIGNGLGGVSIVTLLNFGQVTADE